MIFKHIKMNFFHPFGFTSYCSYIEALFFSIDGCGERQKQHHGQNKKTHFSMLVCLSEDMISRRNILQTQYVEFGDAEYCIYLKSVFDTCFKY